LVDFCTKMCYFFLIDIGYLAGDNSMSGYFIFMPQDKTVASIADAPGSSPSKTQRDCAHDECLQVRDAVSRTRSQENCKNER